MKHELKIGSVSWINDRPNPMYSTLQAVTLSPDWIPKTYLGLSGTSNSAPPNPLADFKAYQRKKDFRAMTFCHFQVEIDDHTKRVSKFSVVDAFHDGGWTPDFKMKSWPSTAFSLDMSIYDRTWYQGEYSPLSMVRTQSRHPNTTISSVPASEIVLVNAIIKFRAGKHTDDIGIKNVKSPFHVPWVWCETLLTYAGGRLKVYGRGSQFPSHAWYVGDKRVHTQSQTADSEFPVTRYGPGPLRHLQIQRLPGAHLRGVPSPALTIAVKQLKLYPILAKGAPAHGPQQGLDARKKRTGAIDLHAYTVGGRAVWSKSL